MKESVVEIYIRQSGRSTLLHVHADHAPELRDGNGCDEPIPIAHLELTILPEWIIDDEQREAYVARGEHMHVRIPIHGGDLPPLVGPEEAQ